MIEELRYFCQLIPQLAEKLTHLDISVEGSAVLFPVVDNVTKEVLNLISVLLRDECTG